MREHLKWLVAARFGGKQIKLADALRVDSPWLSRYLTGRSKHAKDLDSRQLNDYHSSIIHYLGRAELPTETPTATEIAAAAVEATATAFEGKQAQQSPSSAASSSTAATHRTEAFCGEGAQAGSRGCAQGRQAERSARTRSRRAQKGQEIVSDIWARVDVICQGNECFVPPQAQNFLACGALAHHPPKKGK